MPIPSICTSLYGHLFPSFSLNLVWKLSGAMRHHYLFCKAPFRAIAEWHTYVIEILPFHFAPKEMQSRLRLSARCVARAFPYNRGKSSLGFGPHRMLWEVSSSTTPHNHIPTEGILKANFGVPDNDAQ